jgi:hypothetical protein
MEVSKPDRTAIGKAEVFVGIVLNITHKSYISERGRSEKPTAERSPRDLKTWFLNVRVDSTLREEV